MTNHDSDVKPEAACLRGVIFDLDGTLIDSKLDFPKMRSDIGVPADEGILEHIERMPSEEERLRARRLLHAHEVAGARAAEEITGVEEFLKMLRSRGLEIAIFTRNDREPTDIVVDKFFPDVFSAVVTRDDAPAKPDPTGLLKICEQWKCSPDEVIYVGDYRFDLEAGRNAGIKTVLYMIESETPDYASMAHEIVKSFPELLERFDEIVRKLGKRFEN